VNYQIAVTYRCNWACPHCCELFGVLPSMGPESDLTVEDVEMSGCILKEHGIEVGKCGLTGGEPTLVLNLAELRTAVVRCWRPARRPRVFSNGTGGKGRGIRVSDAGAKAAKQYPIMVSPADLGMEPVEGFGTPCWAQIRCGRYFDAFGFSGCPAAPSLGRLFGVDVHEAEPVLLTSRELCRHCIHTVGKRRMSALSHAAATGQIEYPTRTYREALERRRSEGYVRFKSFKERLT